MRIRAGIVVLVALLCAGVGIAATDKRPTVSLASSPSGITAGRPWIAVVRVRGVRPSRFTLTATVGSRQASAPARRWRGDRYRARIVFPAGGRWAVSARIGRARHRLGTVVVRPAPRPPVLLVAPTEAVLEPSGSILVAESGRSRLVRIDPATGRDRLVAPLVQPYELVLTPSGVLYSTSESRVVRVGSDGTTSALADVGEGVGPLAMDAAGNLYFSTVSRIFRIESVTGAVTPYAGSGVPGGGGDGGPALSAQFQAPHGLVVGVDGALYVADTGNQRIRRIDPASRVVTAFAAAVAPAGLAVGPGGVLYVAERDGQRVSRIDPSGAKTVVAGTGVRGGSGDGGPATAARLDEPFDVVPTPDGGVYVIESGLDGGIRRIGPSGTITTLRRR